MADEAWVTTSYERDLDTRLEQPWARVYPGQGGMYNVCPVCKALVSDEAALLDDRGRIVGRWIAQAVRDHIDWHKGLGG